MMALTFCRVLCSIILFHFRINIHGNDLVEKIVEKGVDNFEVEMGLSNEEVYITFR